MDLASAKMIGAGLACIALVGAGIGIGNVFSALIARSRATRHRRRRCSPSRFSASRWPRRPGCSASRSRS